MSIVEDKGEFVSDFKGVISIKPVAGISSTGFGYAVIDWDDKEVAPERRTFNIETYSKLKRDLNEWSTLRPVNEFLATLDRDESFYLVRMFIQAKRELFNINDKSSMMNAIMTIDGVIAKTFKRLNMAKRVFDFVVNESGIRPPVFIGAGTRDHDTPEMTFLTPDYNLVNTIAVITKLLFPIFGEVINAVKFVKNLDNDSKELLAFGVMNTVLSRDFNGIIIKLQNYIGQMINNTIPKDRDDPMLSFRGITDISATSERLAKTFVKSSVNFDLYRAEGGNFITCLAVTIKRASKNDINGKKSSFFARTPLELSASDDDSNVSMQEHEAHLIKEPLEVSILVRSAVERFVSSYLTKNNIDKEMFDRCVGYYSFTIVQPTPINELIAAMFIAAPVGAAYSLKYINMQTMIKIITLVQLYCFKMGFKELIPLVSLKPTGIEKSALDASDNQILISEGRGDNVATNFILKVSEETLHLQDFNQFDLRALIDNVCTFLVKYRHNYNVAPDIEALGEFGASYSDEGALRYGGNVVNEIFRFIYQMLVGEPTRQILC